MVRASRRARLEYHRSHLRYYAIHNGPVERVLLRLLVASRAIAEVATGFVSGHGERRQDGAALLRLAFSRD